MAKKRTRKRKPAARKAKKNPGIPMRKVGRTGTGWIDARRVKIVRRGRKTEVLVQKR